MNSMYRTVFVLTFCTFIHSALSEFSVKWLMAASNPMNAVDILRRIQARLPLSDCRQSLVSELSIQSCEELSAEKLTKLAIEATNCHLEDSGLPRYYCDYNDYTSCTKNMKTNNDFSTFTAFKLDIERICESLERSSSLETATDIITAIQSSQVKSQEKLNVMSSSINTLTNSFASILETNKNIEAGLQASVDIEEKLLETQSALTEHSSSALARIKDESETVNSKIFEGQEKIHEQLKKLDHLSSSIDNRLEPSDYIRV